MSVLFPDLEYKQALSRYFSRYILSIQDTHTAKYSCSSHKKGDKIKLTPRLYLGIFRSRSRAYEAERNFTRELYQLKALIEEGNEDQLSETALNKASTYLSWSKIRNGGIKVVFPI